MSNVSGIGGDLYSAGISYAAIDCFSVVVCLLATIVVFVLKLFQKVVYRLALYQVLSAIGLAAMNIWQFATFVVYDNNPEVYGDVCIAIGWLILYSQWVKLLFTMWLSFYLFCFGVLHKNPKNLDRTAVRCDVITCPSRDRFRTTYHAFLWKRWHMLHICFK